MIDVIFGQINFIAVCPIKKNHKGQYLQPHLLSSMNMTNHF